MSGSRRRLRRVMHQQLTTLLAPSNMSSTPSLYIDNGDCNNICEYCNALFWYDERVVSLSRIGHPKYNQCCKGGRVRLSFPTNPPVDIQRLFEDQQFLDNIRLYNSMFSMTSFGATINDSINDGFGPYVFKIEGQVHHWLGSFCPPVDENPRFLQMYIYDTTNEIHNRIRFFSGVDRTSVSPDTVILLLNVLDTHNELVKLFRTARDLCQSGNIPEFSIRLNSSYNKTCYTAPVDDCIGAIVFDNDSMSHSFDIIVRHKDTGPQRVSKLHPLYMALQYPLLFIYGESGWSPALRLYSESNNTRNHLTSNMFYSYQLHDRLHTYTLLLRAGRLFQQYLVDAYVCIEQERLDYVRYNQSQLRTEHLSGVHDAISRGDNEGRDIGKRVILPSSFVGGPRYMYKHYHDALAICRVHGNPQYFVTFTCNVGWPEIKRYLSQYPTLKANDRPDIVARVFQIKVDSLLDFLKTKRPFGLIVANLYTIEFQKRGLPHCHLLLWVGERDKIRNPEELDAYISAEIPDLQSAPVLHKIVTDLMIHGPCGLLNPYASCMSDGSCSKKFPKPYSLTTSFDKNGYAHYKRTPSTSFVIKNGVQLDNGYVVPYNKMLLLHFHAHINVEYCGWNMMIKYLFKYISKGADRIRFRIETPTELPVNTQQPATANIDEIKNFVDARFICPHEASWRLLNFPIHVRHPPVQMLAVHLEQMQNIYFRENDHLQGLLQNQFVKRTTLTEWLRNNEFDVNGRHLSYIDYVNEYRWDYTSRHWVRRSQNREPTIGRLVYIHPTCGEPFYLRLLLSHQKGCRSFADIRSVSGEVLPTYRAACEKLGLLGNDQEWEIAITEAASWATPSELRSLFTHMLLYCEVQNPLHLWERHWHMMSDDIQQRHHLLNADDLKHLLLYELELLLNSGATASSLTDYGLPLPREDLLQCLRNRLLMEEKNYDREKLATDHMILREKLHPQQRLIYEKVMNAMTVGSQALVFVYGHGGTGKTFLWTTIISALRSEGRIVLAVAASGIASLLLPSGRTAHSRFKIPQQLTESSICGIRKNTHLAQLLHETSLIIWDEAPMSDRRCFESLDRCLKDILNCNDRPFGGKSILLGGDFRQTLPIISGALKPTILASSLPRSYLWNSFQVCKLTENMRLLSHCPNQESMSATADFSAWLLDIGDGKVGNADESNPHDAKIVTIPAKYTIPFSDHAIHDLISFIYDKTSLTTPCPATLSQKAIVCPRNETVDLINDIVLKMVPSQGTIYHSNDSIVPRTGSQGDIEVLYPPEYLNLLNFSGLPPHRLELKVNTPVILLRNINQTAGLCNGTRLIVTQLLSKIIEARVITGTAIGHRVYIPRISLTHDNDDFPFILKRKQFPLKLCYAMSINKSQGQSLTKIGVYLPQPVFGHGQLYVAFSRATSPDGLRVLIVPNESQDSNNTKNIVYSDYLQEIDQTYSDH